MTGAEQDFICLGQIFDCIVLGPLARVDFWDR